MGNRPFCLTEDFFSVLEVFLRGPEEFQIVFSGDILVEIFADSLRMTHLSEDATVRRGDAFDRTDRSIGIKSGIHAGLALLIHILRCNLPLLRQLSHLVIGGQEAALSVGDGHPEYLSDFYLAQPGRPVGDNAGPYNLGLVTPNGISCQGG